MDIRNIVFSSLAFALTLVPALAAKAEPTRFFTEGFGEIHISLDSQNNRLKAQWRFDNATVDGKSTSGFAELNDIAAVTDATFTRSDPNSVGYDGLGVAPGESVFHFPSSNSNAAAARVPYVAWRNDIAAGVLVRDRLDIQLTGLRRLGPGQTNLSIWYIAILNPEFPMRSDDGIGINDSITVLNRSHYNLGILSGDSPGTLVASFRATGELQSGGTVSGNFDLYFLACKIGTCPDDTPPSRFFTEGNGEIALSVDSQTKELKAGWKFDRATVDGEVISGTAELDKVAAVTDLRLTRPVPDPNNLFAALGVEPGASVFHFPATDRESRSAKVPYLAWTNETANGILKNDRIDIQLTGLIREDKPETANFSAWSNALQGPEFEMRSDNGFGSDDSISLFSRNHYNLGLLSGETPGAMIASFRATAELQNGRKLHKDFNVHFLACETGACPDDSVPAPALGDMQRGLMLFGLLALAGLGLATPGRFRFA